MGQKYDVLIIGAGLAGLSAAKVIAESLKVTIGLIEAREPGSNNSTPLTFADVLQKHDILDCARERYSSFRFDNYQGSLVTYALREKHLIALNYKKACQKIFNNIMDSDSSIESIHGRAISFKNEKNAVAVELEDGKVFLADYVIDASGASQMAVNTFNPGFDSYYSHVYGGYFSKIHSPNKEICAFLLPSTHFGSGGGWFYSEGEEKASFGYAHITKDNNFASQQMKAVFEKAKKNFKPYSDYMQPAHLDHVECGIIPITPLQKFVYDRVLVTGDAAGMATNWTCMGVEPALKYGQLAGQIVLSALKVQDSTLLMEFQHAWDKENRILFNKMTEMAPWYWSSSLPFWEFVMTCDLKYLPASKIMERLRHNKYLSNSYQLLVRKISRALKSFITREAPEPQEIFIRE